mmetsp:Transcript_33094/g.53333  ORF Transcript_33094/g.53333 Transcript_33094/m.53333 type:complete len:248 (-) Transcript_33094:520-1263(-)
MINVAVAQTARCCSLAASCRITIDARCVKSRWCSRTAISRQVLQTQKPIPKAYTSCLTRTDTHARSSPLPTSKDMMIVVAPISAILIQASAIINTPLAKRLFGFGGSGPPHRCCTPPASNALLGECGPGDPSSSATYPAYPVLGSAVGEAGGVEVTSASASWRAGKSLSRSPNHVPTTSIQVSSNSLNEVRGRQCSIICGSDTCSSNTCAGTSVMESSDRYSGNMPFGANRRAAVAGRYTSTTVSGR